VSLERLGISVATGFIVVFLWVLAGLVVHGLINAFVVGWDLWRTLADL